MDLVFQVRMPVEEQYLSIWKKIHENLGTVMLFGERKKERERQTLTPEKGTHPNIDSI